MANIIKEGLLYDAGLIRSATEDSFNTAERVGKMFVDIINNLSCEVVNDLITGGGNVPLSAEMGKLLSQLKLSYYDASWIFAPSLRTVENYNAFAQACSEVKVIYLGQGMIAHATHIPMESRIHIWYYSFYPSVVQCYLANENGTITLSRNIVIALADNADVTDINNRLTAAESTITDLGTRMTAAESNVTSLTSDKLSYYDVGWTAPENSSQYTVANFNALSAAITAGKQLFYEHNIAVGSVHTNKINLTVAFYNKYRQAEIWLINGNVTVEWDDYVVFADAADVEDLQDAVEALKEEYLTQAEYDEKVDEGTIDPDCKYFIYEE